MNSDTFRSMARQGTEDNQDFSSDEEEDFSDKENNEDLEDFNEEGNTNDENPVDSSPKQKDPEVDKETKQSTQQHTDKTTSSIGDALNYSDKESSLKKDENVDLGKRGKSLVGESKKKLSTILQNFNHIEKSMKEHKEEQDVKIKQLREKLRKLRLTFKKNDRGDQFSNSSKLKEILSMIQKYDDHVENLNSSIKQYKVEIEKLLNELEDNSHQNNTIIENLNETINMMNTKLQQNIDSFSTTETVSPFIGFGNDERSEKVEIVKTKQNFIKERKDSLVESFKENFESQEEKINENFEKINNFSKKIDKMVNEFSIIKNSNEKLINWLNERVRKYEISANDNDESKKYDVLIFEEEVKESGSRLNSLKDTIDSYKSRHSQLKELKNKRLEFVENTNHKLESDISELNNRMQTILQDLFK
jgi:chromosome segregation ATPase